MTAKGHSVANAERSCGCDCGTCATASRTGIDTVVLSNPHTQASLRDGDVQLALRAQPAPYVGRNAHISPPTESTAVMPRSPAAASWGRTRRAQRNRAEPLERSAPATMQTSRTLASPSRWTSPSTRPSLFCEPRCEVRPSRVGRCNGGAAAQSIVNSRRISACSAVGAQVSVCSRTVCATTRNTVQVPSAFMRLAT